MTYIHIYAFICEQGNLWGEFQNVHESIFYGEFKGEKMGMGEIIDRFECEAEDPTYYALSEQPLIEF